MIRLHPMLVSSVTCWLACAPTFATAGEPIEDCYRENFPVALGIPQSAVPKQVRFYCAAPWNMNVMEEVRKALDRARFDMLGATLRMSSATPDSPTGKAAAMAIGAADKGPPAMLGTMYRIHFALPVMHALHTQSRDAQYIKSKMHSQDVEALTNAAKAVDWTRGALLPNGPLSRASRLKPDATLSEVATFIVAPTN